ncbi:Stress-induced protein [Bordetella sputigena]|uniref:hypothetical protein n=1 Tax=Bordetella sputigena TaxID=1416810 RepID=UPI0039EED9E2
MTKPSTPNPAALPTAREGAHEKAPDEQIRSRSADPGQSSYGGFKGEDPRRQAEDLARDDGPDRPSKTAK